MYLCIAVWLLSIGATLAQARVHIHIGGTWVWRFLISVGNNANQSDMAITAAHCIVNGELLENIRECMQTGGKEHIPLPEPLYLDKDELSVTAGNHAISSSVEMRKENGVERRSISRMETHPKFGAECIDFRHDIAVLKLNKPISFTPKIQPIRLPNRGHTLKGGQACTTAGWGYIGTSENRCIELIAMAETISGMRIQRLVPEFMYCANPGRDMAATCTRDSGGPLFCKEKDEWIANGVLSNGYPDCNGHGDKHWASPELFTKIEPYLDWIEGKIRDWSALVN